MSGFFIHGEQMLFGSVCSGIEAASVAFYPLGWRAAWLSEIEPFPSAVLAHHYPSVPNLGDMTRLPAAVLTGEAAAPDVLCGGTPCQAFSVAGMRVSIHARHCWRANPFACNTLPSNGFFLCLREPSDAVLCLHKKPPPDHQKPNKNKVLRSARTSR